MIDGFLNMIANLKNISNNYCIKYMFMYTSVDCATQ